MSVPLSQSVNASVPEPTGVAVVIGAALKLPPTFWKIVNGTLACPLTPLPLNVYQRCRVAPPAGATPANEPRPIAFHRAPIRCPNCGSAQTEEIARFGSTACKAQYRCKDCLEPFDYFKPH